MLYNLRDTRYQQVQELIEIPSGYDAYVDLFVEAFPLLRPGYVVDWVAQPVFMTERGKRDVHPIHHNLAIYGLYVTEMKERSKKVRCYQHHVFKERWVRPNEKIWKAIPHLITNFVAETLPYKEVAAFMKAELYIREPKHYPDYQSFVPPEEPPEPVADLRFNREPLL